MLRRDKHFGPRPQIVGRRRILDPEKKVELCEHVAKGAPVEDAADTVGVSLRTVQRERKLDEDFDHELQLSLRQPPDPLKMMQHAARAHWRAAAWLLERTDPEQFAKRAKSSISPAQFHAGLEFVMEAALAGVPEELHEQVYEYMAAAAEEAHECLFPNHGRWGDAKRPKLPPTPLVERQFRHRCTDPKFQRVVAQDELGRITEDVPTQLPPHLQPRPRPAHLQPRARPGGRAPSRRVGAMHPPSPREERSALHEEPRNAKPAGADPPREPASASEGRSNGAPGANPRNDHQQPKPPRGDVARALPEARGAAVASLIPRVAAGIRRFVPPLLSPKTRFATKPDPGDANATKRALALESTASENSQPE